MYLTIQIIYKGKIYKKIIHDERIKHNCRIIILLGTKDKNYYMADAHYICMLKSGSLYIPNTTIISKETGWINITLNSSEFKQYPRKEWKIPIHAIASNKSFISIDFNCSIEL